MSSRSLPNLDLLRSLAIALVVIDHVALSAGHTELGPFSAGWIGVSGVFLFFVHTSLVLMASLRRRPYALDFYIRRVFRIYPLALSAIALAVLTGAPVGGTVDQWFQHAPLGAKVLVSNVLLIQNLTGQPSVLNVLWSLPLEVQMYLLLPPLFLFIARPQRFYTLLLLWLFAVALCALVFPKTAMNLATAIPLFLPGIIAYIGFSRWQPRLPAWCFPAMVLALLGGFWLRPSIHYGWVLALSIGLLLPLFYQLHTPWVLHATHAIAKYSYGTYLVHPFALALGFYLLSGKPFALRLAVALSTTAAGSIAAYHLIEKPMMDIGARIAARAEARHREPQPA